jgi:hypothetical protein
MSTLPKPDDPIPLPNATADAEAALARRTVRLFAHAMQAAENAIDTMVYFAKQIEDHGKYNPDAMKKAMDAAGMTELDRRCLARLLEIQDWPKFKKLASGCLQIGSMANARREAKETT